MSEVSLDHFHYTEYEAFYEPSDDTFLLMDALAADARRGNSAEEEGRSKGLRRSRLCLEIGPGSGAVISSLGKLLGPDADSPGSIPPLLLACDISAAAARATARTAKANRVLVDIVHDDLGRSLLRRLAGQVDILVFNPPYVPTPPDEVEQGGISAAWAGGDRGREVIDKFLPLVPQFLSIPYGACYMVVVKDNDPDEIARAMEQHKLVTSIIVERQARNEELAVMKFTWR